MKLGPPLSRKTRKDLANAFMKYRGETRAEANYHATFYWEEELALWKQKKTHKNPRRRVGEDLHIRVRQGPNQPYGMKIIVHCGQDKKPSIKWY